jgi:hypothetical protein
MKRFMKKGKIEKLKEIITLAKELFDKENYKNVTFFKGVVVTVLVLATISLFSTLYFTAKVFNFVTDRITGHTEMVHSKIGSVHEAFEHISQRAIDEGQDERLIADQMRAAQKKKEKEAALKARKQKIEQDITRFTTMSYLDIIEEAKIHKIYARDVYSDQLDYLEKCGNHIEAWIGKRQGLIELKLRVAEKYKEDIKNGRYEGQGGKRGKEEYILEASKLDPDISYENLFNTLKTKPSKELLLDKHWLDEEDHEELKLCINSADRLSKSLYHAIYLADATKNRDGWDGDTLQLERFSKALGIKDLDFTIPLILANEAIKFRAVTPFSNGNDVYESMRTRSDRFYEYAPQAMTIFEATNQKLAEIEQSNIGFQTNAYKYRMEQYEYFKTKWAELQEQQRKAAAVKPVKHRFVGDKGDVEAFKEKVARFRGQIK